MKRVLMLLLLLAVLLLVWLWQSGRLTPDKDTSFAIADTETIGRIFLADRSNQTILLVREEDGSWRLNDSLPARDAEVNELLRTLRLLAVRQPVPRSSQNTVVTAMATDNTKVEVYDRNGDLLRAFYVGGPASDKRGNYMRLEGSNRLYVVHIPGFEGMLQTRFSTDIVAWQDKAVFRYEPYTIKSIQIEYTGYPEASFLLEVVSRDSFQLSSLGDVPAMVQADNKTLAAYVNQYRNIQAEAYVNHLPIKDTVLLQTPFCVMTVTDTAGVATTARLYRKPVNQRTKQQFDAEGNEIPFDRDRDFALIHEGKDFVIIQQFVFGKLLRSYFELARPKS